MYQVLGTQINECRTFSTTITYNINHVFGGQNYSFSPQLFFLLHT